MKNSTEIKGLSTKELKEKIDADVMTLNQMRINHSISPLDSPAELRKMRRSIARMKTELHQRERENK